MSDDMTTGNQGETGRTLDRVFQLLADRHRRYALYYLDETETDVVALDELADYVASRAERNAEEDEQTNGTAQERIRLHLHHNHLPQLAETGLIDYDTRSQTVRNWGELSLTAWTQRSQNELPQLRSLFCTSVLG